MSTRLILLFFLLLFIIAISAMIFADGGSPGPAAIGIAFLAILVLAITYFASSVEWLTNRTKNRENDWDNAVSNLVEPNLPTSEFAVGDRVAVRVNERNQTPHVGEVRQVVWHFKDSQYNYYLSENGKKLSKRYFAEDLERVPAG